MKSLLVPGTQHRALEKYTYRGQLKTERYGNLLEVPVDVGRQEANFRAIC